MNLYPSYLKKKFEFIVFDTLAKSMIGGKENDATDMGIVVDNAEEVMRVTQASVMLVHHTGYDKGHARGSTALPAAASYVFALSKQGESTTQLKFENTKGIQEPEPKYFTLTKVRIDLAHHEIEADEEPYIDSAVAIVAGGIPTASLPSNFTNAHQTVLKTVVTTDSFNAIQRSVMPDAPQAGRNGTLTELLNDLQSLKLVQKLGTPKRPKYKITDMGLRMVQQLSTDQKA